MMAASASLVNLSRGPMSEFSGVLINKYIVGVTRTDLSGYPYLVMIKAGFYLLELLYI